MKDRKRAHRLQKGNTHAQKNEQKVPETKVQEDTIPEIMDNYLKGHDLFGQYVSVSYQGQQTYTTSFGGLLSIAFKVFMFIFLSNQVKIMWTKAEWELTQQTISATKETMQVLHNFKNESYQNISVGIQLKPKMKVVDDPEGLKDDAKKLQRYVNIFGMIEKFKNQIYSPFDTNINEDIQSWKLYENNLTENGHGLMEFQVNVEDAALKGSEENLNEVDQVLSTYQMRVNNTSRQADAFQTCANNTFFKCDQHLSSLNDAFRLQKEHIFKSKKQDSASRIQEVDQIMTSKSQDDKLVFMHQYHSETLKESVEYLTKDVRQYETNLVADYEQYLTNTFDLKVKKLYTDYYDDKLQMATDSNVIREYVTNDYLIKNQSLLTNAKFAVSTSQLEIVAGELAIQVFGTFNGEITRINGLKFAAFYQQCEQTYKNQVPPITTITHELLYAADPAVISCISYNTNYGITDGRADINYYKSQYDYGLLVQAAHQGNLDNANNKQIKNRQKDLATEVVKANLAKKFFIITAEFTEIKERHINLTTKWGSQSTYHSALDITLDYSKPETIACQLNIDMDKYLENYNTSKNGNLTQVLENSFKEDFYQGDQAFGCSSIGLDFDFTNNENVKKIKSHKEQIAVLKERLTMYNRNNLLYQKELDRIMAQFQYQLVVYDESEQFRDHSDPLFQYPYEPRKNILGKETLGFKQKGHQAFTVSFSLSDVCLEGEFYDQISNVVIESGSSVIELKSYLQGEEEDEDEHKSVESVLQRCDNKQYFKLKQSNVDKEHKFEEDLYDHKTLMEIVLIADTKVTQSKRKSVQILDLMGDIAAFFEAMIMIVGVVASAVSAKKLQANIAKNYYIRKKNKSELSQESEEVRENIDRQPEKMFERINMSSWVLMKDTFLCTILSPCSKFKCCLRTPCFRRTHILEKCEERFQQELDVNTIIKRTRYSYNSLSQLENKDIKKYLRLNESTVVMNSEQSEEADNFDFQVNKGYFSSTDDENANKHKEEEEDDMQDPFLLELQDGITKSVIQGMKISKEQKMQIQGYQQSGQKSMLQRFKSNFSAQRLINTQIDNSFATIQSPRINDQTNGKCFETPQIGQEERKSNPSEKQYFEILENRGGEVIEFKNRNATDSEDEDQPKIKSQTGARRNRSEFRQNKFHMKKQIKVQDLDNDRKNKPEPLNFDDEDPQDKNSRFYTTTQTLPVDREESPATPKMKSHKTVEAKAKKNRLQVPQVSKSIKNYLDDLELTKFIKSRQSTEIKQKFESSPPNQSQKQDISSSFDENDIAFSAPAESQSSSDQQ